MTSDASQAAGKRKVLVTGAAGHIGSYFAEHCRERYDLRLMVRPGEEAAKVEAIRAFGQVVEADLVDGEAIKRCCQGTDAVVHLAADPMPAAAWESILPNNIVGTYNVFAGARAAGCRRVVYASSIHAVGGYLSDVQVRSSDPVNPLNLYGVSKCFGEALARYMAEQQGVSSICIRIGACGSLKAFSGRYGVTMMDIIVSLRDLTQLICRCIEAEGVRFAILHGLSDNPFKRLDISSARQIVGYEPEDNPGEVNELLRPLHLGQRTNSNMINRPPPQAGKHS